VAEDRNLLERAQNYLTSGRFDKDARYVLGPHLSSGIQGLINLFGPQADIQAMVNEAGHAGRSFRKGDSLGGVTSLITAAAAPFLIGTPGSVTSFKTSRGKNPSTYTWDGKSTQRIRRSPDDHSDKTTATQPKSGRTIFLDKQTARTVTKYFNSLGDDISLVPTSENTARIIRNKDYGPKKAGEVAEIKFSSQPEVGLHPFEMGSSTSPSGKDMRFYSITDESGEKVLGGQHMGTPITKLITKKGGGKEVSENLPKFKKGLKSVNIEEDLFKDILKTPEGDPIVIYRGIVPDEIGSGKGATKDMLKGKSRKGYATFLSDNPSVAGSYAGTEGVIAPFVVKPKKVIVYEDNYMRRKSPLSFDKFEFDRQASLLGPGEVLVARNVRDPGPRIIRSGPDDPKYWSYGSDLYAVKDETVLLSAIDPKLRYAGGSVMERNPYNYQPKAI
jgi:hypothetical protein